MSTQPPPLSADALSASVASTIRTPSSIVAARPIAAPSWNCGGDQLESGVTIGNRSQLVEQSRSTLSHGNGHAHALPSHDLNMICFLPQIGVRRERTRKETHSSLLSDSAKARPLCPRYRALFSAMAARGGSGTAFLKCCCSVP